MPVTRGILGVCLAFCLAACEKTLDQTGSLFGCMQELSTGARPIGETRADRFQGKVQPSTARCRGGDTAEARQGVPWLDWPNYYAAGNVSTKDFWPLRNWRGVNGALIDLEYERVELIRFNLFDNSGTYQGYLTGSEGREGSTLKVWPEMRLPPDNPNYQAVGGPGPQHCRGDLIRGRTLSGICNDVFNPLMGSAGTLFARNVEFETTFPDAGLDSLTRNRHGGRLSLMTPDPQVISRKLFTRPQHDSAACNNGYGMPGDSKEGYCDYKKAPFFNVLAAFWIQFMTHDWFSHLEEGHNAAEYMKVGCASQKVAGVETPLPAADAARLGCRPADAMDRAFVAESTAPSSFTLNGHSHLTRAPKTFRNTNTAWWDASQIYGYDDRSGLRVKRDPKDPARLLMVGGDSGKTEGDRQGYLPVLAPSDPMNPDWAGQEATGFPDNWTIGMSFYHNVFAREHNQFVDAFRRQAEKSPEEDSGLRNPANPGGVIRNKDVTAEELFEAARLVVSAEIAKIHTIEWTTQLLYDEPLFRGMNANWSGLLAKNSFLSKELARMVDQFRASNSAAKANAWYSVLASGPGIVGLGSDTKGWSLDSLDYVNGGTNHFGSPFNFPEEFVTVYRLHALVPDLVEYRELPDPNQIRNRIPVVETFRGAATGFMHDHGLSNWALSLGRQRLGLLALQNHPRFLQNLRVNRLKSPTQTIDVAALDLIRDRERGVPRFNEFRRQYGLRQLTSFDDFINHQSSASDQAEQAKLVATIREVYGQHRCDSTKVITDAQLNSDGTPINDCLGHANGTMVDNVEDLDTVVGWLAESTRPHGFAISETQFVVFILNASRRLYSDRFFTSSFRPEFYTRLGIDWVNNNGPMPMMESLPSNGHSGQPVSPLKRVLLRTMPELKPELDRVVNAFDPWARDRGEYYSLQWKARPDARDDPAFADTLW